jgi:site-specific recombinase XerD
VEQVGGVPGAAGSAAIVLHITRVRTLATAPFLAPPKEVAMLAEIYPRDHARFTSLPVLGPHLDGFVAWLRLQGYPHPPIRLRIRETPRLDAMLHRRRVRGLGVLSRTQFLEFAPQVALDDVYLSAAVRSLASYLDARGLFARPAATPHEQMVAAYRAYLGRVRGLADATATQHCSTASELLTFLGFDGDRAVLRRLGARQIETFVRAVGTRVSRASLQHTVARLRSFLRFLTSRNEIARGLDSSIDTPRLYRGERLPRSLPWESVQAFLAAIDRSTPKGRRDYAMFLLIATYGLRTSEIAGLHLDDFEWRAGRVRVSRPKIQAPIVLPLTEEVGAALFDYLRKARPDLPHREVFLRARAPAGPIGPKAVTSAFREWACRSALPIPYQGPHCLRHSLAVHLLRQGTSLKAIGDLLGHRSAESTCVYLRLHVDDLRDAALDLPREAAHE